MSDIARNQSNPNQITAAKPRSDQGENDLPPEALASKGPSKGLRQTTLLSRRFGLQAALLAAALYILTCGSANAELTATLSASTLLPGQPVVLTLTQTGAAGAAINLEPLQLDFQITNRGSRSEIRVINGQRQNRQELRLTLLPRRTGTLTVPALRAGNDVTRPLTLVVAPTKTLDATLLSVPNGIAQEQPVASPPLAIEIEARVEPAQVRVQQQVVLTVRVSSPKMPPSGHLHEPHIAAARVLPLGEERRIENTNEGNLQVYERRFAVFPAKPGKLDIPAQRFDAWRTAGGAPVPFESDALSVDVQPAVAAPATSKDNIAWLPARALTLVEAGPTAVRLAPGQTLTRMITLRGDGVMAEDLPAIPLQIPFLLRMRNDPPRLWNEHTPNGVIGYRSERVLIGTSEEGVYQLPGAGIDWWNTETERWEQATLPAWTVTVAAFISENRRPAATWNEWPPAVEDSSKGSIAADTNSDSDVPTSPWWTAFWPWFWGFIAIIVITLLVIILVRRREQRPAPEIGMVAPDEFPVTEQTSEEPFDATISKLQQAYDRGDANAAREALLDWGKQVWPESVPANLSQLALRVEPPLRDEIRLLDKAFFSPTPIDWTGSPVWERLASAVTKSANEQKSSGLTQ